MRAVHFERYGGPEVVSIRDLPDAKVRVGRLLIRVKAASLNRSDWESLTAKPVYVRLGGNGFRRPAKTGLGTDVAGVIEAVGEGVDTWSPGDRVLGDLLWTGPSTLAEYADPPVTAPLARIPDRVTYEEAAAIGQSGGLAWQGLTEAGQPAPGSHVLIIGGGGGGGSFAIQLARHFGAEVTAVDSRDKLEFMESLGADHVSDYQSENIYKRRVRYDRILDFAGKRSVFAHRRGLAGGGIYRMVGGSVPRLLELVTAGSIMSATSDRSIRLLIAKPNAEDLTRVAQLVADGVLQVPIDRAYPLEQTADALRRLGPGQQLGKLVITV